MTGLQLVSPKLHCCHGVPAGLLASGLLITDRRKRKRMKSAEIQ